MFLAVNILLWLVVAALAFTAALRGRVLFNEGARDGVLEFIRLLPRIGAGVIGSGFIAEILPKATVASWIGPDSGFLGVVIATLGGALTPGGPVVGFAIGSAALKSGAGRTAGDRLFHRLGALRHPPAGGLGSAVDAAAHGLAARGGVAAAAVHRGGIGDDAGAALNREHPRFQTAAGPAKILGNE